MNTRRKKIGLALGGGAARGLAHIGVLQVLQREGIPIDFIAGTSAGAIIGAAYACCMDVERLTRDALDANWKKMRPLIDPSLSKSGFIKGKKIRDLIATYVGGDVDFSELKIPFACVATDIDTGEEIIFNSGPVMDALRATISLPGIFTVVKHGDRYVVDGGLTTPVPVEVVRKMGAEVIIAVNVNPGVAGRVGKVYRQRIEAHKVPSLIQVMMQSLYITAFAVAKHALENADIVIAPDVEHVGGADFNRAPELIAHGREATEKALPEIKKKIS
jgi:NTE family protein